MRMIIIAVAAVLLLGGGGAGAYFYFMNPAEASVGEDEGVDSHGEEEKHAEKGDHGKGSGVAEFVELDPLILPIVDNNGVSQVVSIVIALEVPDAHAKDVVKQMTPRLKDAFIQDMYGVLNEHAALKGGVLQVRMLKERLNEISNNVAGDEMVNDVLLQVVQQRPI